MLLASAGFTVCLPALCSTPPENTLLMDPPLYYKSYIHNTINIRIVITLPKILAFQIPFLMTEIRFRAPRTKCANCARQILYLIKGVNSDLSHYTSAKRKILDKLTYLAIHLKVRVPSNQYLINVR